MNKFKHLKINGYELQPQVYILNKEIIRIFKPSVNVAKEYGPCVWAVRLRDQDIQLVMLSELETVPPDVAFLYD